MDKKFENATSVVREYLKANKYSYGTTMSHLRCYKLFGAYLLETGTPYCSPAEDEWIRSITLGLDSTTLSIYKRALIKLNKAYNNEEINNSVIRRRTKQNHQHLSQWSRVVLNEFMDSVAGDNYDNNYYQSIRRSNVWFLKYLTGKGIVGPEDITHRLIADFYREDKHENYKTKDIYNNCIRKFLRFLSGKGIIKPSIPLALDKNVLSRLVFLDNLSADEQRGFIMASNHTTLSAEVYYCEALKMNTLIEQHKYSKTMKKTFAKAWKEMFVFLEANGLDYSDETALSWANHMSHYTVQWKSFRRAMKLFMQYRTNGQIMPQKVCRYGQDRVEALPAWCKDDYKSYYRLKVKEGHAKSTLDMCRSSCLRLLEYVVAMGVIAWDDITPVMLKEFHRQDPHSTAESKNAYSSKIRGFLEYLGEHGKVPPTLFMAMPSESAPRASLVHILNDEEIADIYRFKDKADDPLNLRHAAMVLIGLRMGMRASDIVKLRFSDISWEQKTISIQQQKTDRFIMLPMPVEVGNALYQYVMHGRPDVSAGHIFISHRVPYSKLHPAACRKALKAALPEKQGGFHVARKTFASRMLLHDVAVGRIAESLGHAANESVMTYLSTNSDKMRLCALSLDAVPVKGGMLS